MPKSLKRFLKSYPDFVTLVIRMELMRILWAMSYSWDVVSFSMCERFKVLQRF